MNMDRYDRYVYDHDIITAILDMCPVMYRGLQDKNNAYVIPMNYGYLKTEDKLILIIHTPNDCGYKRRLIENNPVACCTFAAWANHPDRPYKGLYHDYRSVMAFGKMRKINYRDPNEPCRDAMKALFANNHRTRCVDPGTMVRIDLYAIECDWEDVSAKTESPVRSVEDVPFVDWYNVPEDNERYDISDLKAEREDRVKNRRYLGYLTDEE